MTLAVAASMSAVVARANATEMGGGIYPNGAEGLYASALPPPGTYWLNYVMYYEAGRFNDGDGDELIPDFELSGTIEALRFVHVTDRTLLGATWAFQVIVPIVQLSVEAGGVSDSAAGLGDLNIDPIVLGWHGERMHYVFGIDFNIPTAAYDPLALANIGRNHFNIEPILAVGYLDPTGLELTAKFMYDFNFRNDEGAVTPFNPTGAGYRSGQEFHVDFGAGWNFGSWEAGVAGYYYVQTTGDEIDDPVADAALDALFDGFRGEVLAIGPSARLAVDGFQMIATWQHEVFSAYKPEGDRFWFKTVLRF
ncbi:transporter [Zavarzinia compransoris]|uniref:SphA family protein n=1 Tax=Zavarzinia marina TaxID=2911065 RepID=UPI001F2EDC71|nr:transporter [Zavarzinia marina]MCF4166070.1 transporter [Zavarzinia marina]